MVKKVIFNILIFISIFVFIDKVSASFEEIAPVFNSSYTSTELNSFVNNTSPSLSGGSSTYNYIMNNFIANELYLEYGEYYICLGIGTSYRSYCFISDDVEAFKIQEYTANTYLRLNIDISTSSVYAYSVNNGSKESSKSDWYTSSHYSNYFLNYQLNHTSMYIKTNLPYIKYSNIGGNNTFKTADGYVFNNDDIMFYLDDNNNFVVNTDYKTSISKYDTYTLSNLEYSAIEVQFNVNDFTMIDEGNDINLEYEINLQNEMMIPLLPIPQEKIYRNLAPEEYTLGTTVSLLFDEKANIYTYDGTKHYDYWNTITYRFEFPFTNDYVGNITLNFWSDSNYTITLEERTNEENDIKYTELDLTGKYGVGFIPKVINSGMYKEFYGIFKIPMQNNYKLLFYKDYNLIKNNNKSNLLEDKVLLSLENFEYLFTKENDNSYLLFINNNFENGTNASIYYNSNYFNYCILDESISTCNIINPNTNEDTNINTNLSDVDSFKIANIFDTFLSFSNSTNFILENVTHFYNDYLPTELKAFFYISFGFVVIIIITKIVL